MIHCQNCGRKSHCGVPHHEEISGSIIRICKKCRCEKCSDSSHMQETYEENKRTPFTFHDQSNWDWE